MKKIAIAAVLCLAAALVIVLMAQGGSAPHTSRTFSGSTLDGSGFDLGAVSGRPVVINFWGSWCKWCAREAPDLAAFARAHPDVLFVGVDVNDDDPAARAFSGKYALPFVSVVDHSGSIAAQFGVTGYPTTVFLDHDHVERARIVGAGSPQAFAENLQKAL